MTSAPFVPAVQRALFPAVSLYELPEGLEGLGQANRLLELWRHELGPINRPFGSQAWVLEIDERPVSVAVSVSIVPDATAGYACGELVELGRLCSDPAAPWCNRVMLRLWREVCGPRWPYWTPRAAVSYSLNKRHEGQIYRFDGWRKVREDAGADCGPNATWSKRRGKDHAASGAKTLWLWEYGRAGGVALSGELKEEAAGG